MKTVWTKEKCIESASSYSKRLDWHTQAQSAYQAARKNGWHEECCKHMQVLVVVWTKENCINNARKYKTLTQWIKAEKRAYGAAIRYKWLDECRAHMLNTKVLYKEACISIAKKYISINDWINASNKTYHMAWRCGWLDECTAHMVKKNWMEKGYWTKERCIENAFKFNRISDWVQSDKGKAYRAASRIGCAKECTAHMIKRISIEALIELNSYTKEMCMESSTKHLRINNWIKTDRMAYKAAKHFNWLKDCTAHMKKVEHWDKDKCIKTARQFTMIKDWQNNYGSAYVTARINGWFDECTEHMKKNKIFL